MQTLVQLLPTAEIGTALPEITSMKFTAHPAIAIVIGVGIGILSTVGIRKAMNEKTIQSCYQKVDHQLILTSDFIGDTYFCVNTRYLQYG